MRCKQQPIQTSNRFKIFKSGYKVDKYIFQVFLGALFLLVLGIGVESGYNYNYFKCSIPSYGAEGSYKVQMLDGTYVSMCKNPFYKSGWENQEYLPDGEYGNARMPAEISLVEAFAFMGLFMCLLINHLYYNREVKK